ncbi:hypothetical protein L6R50_10805 [Myxococcota bacterium]|nr:hypothetical protein [Myxococcota bacterium]
MNTCKFPCWFALALIPLVTGCGTGESVDWTLCSDTCDWAWDGECDDGGYGADTEACEYGTDCGDCGER